MFPILIEMFPINNWMDFYWFGIFFSDVGYNWKTGLDVDRSTLKYQNLIIDSFVFLIIEVNDLLF